MPYSPKNKLDQILELKIRDIDPVLSAGKASDLYSEVIKTAAISSDLTFDTFSERITNALLDIYGAGWLLNEDVSENLLIAVLYDAAHAYFFPQVPKLLDPEFVWYDGSVCKFVSCMSSDIPTGINRYVTHDEDGTQELIFCPDEAKEEVLMVYFGDLSIEINTAGRILYPGHNFDNLFIEERKHIPIGLPDNVVKGRAYLTTPPKEILEEYFYFLIKGFSDKGFGDMIVDKEKKIIQFGTSVGTTNVEVVEGFILSFNEEHLVNAWVKLENVEP